MTDILETWLIEFGIPITGVAQAKLVVLIVSLGIVILTIDRLVKMILVRWIRSLIERLESPLGNTFLEKKVFRAVANFVHIVAIQTAIPVAFSDFPEYLPIAYIANEIYIIIAVLWILSAGFNALGAHARQIPALQDKPIDSYIQLAKIVNICIGGLFILSILLGKSLPYLFGTLGATSAILLLVFKDSILGFVASIQVSVNDIVRIGDWIENPKYGADGDVIQITLTTVKVQNWDKTITTIPTYALISDSFKNWRGMRESGGRRIKRPIYLKICSFRFCDDGMMDRMQRIPLLTDYLKDRTVSGPHEAHALTNIGLFRRYINAYLRAHPHINRDLLLMVRQLEPQEHGLPLEIYAFTNTVEWIEYE
ncbi:uncharacterized protein METZ01_LOCUS143790, partial [marine metagenome]